MAFGRRAARNEQERLTQYESSLARQRGRDGDDGSLDLTFQENRQLMTGLQQVATSGPIGERGDGEHAEDRTMMLMGAGAALAIFVASLFVFGVL